MKCEGVVAERRVPIARQIEGQFQAIEMARLMSRDWYR